MNEQMLFQVISQLSMQYASREGLAEDAAVAKATAFVEQMVNSARELANKVNPETTST